ncbi:MAG TPA: AAA family ATPase, partial [Caldilineae bacterium]|nr:AAA family ATPase [Caldilineae bacterium]
MDRARVIKNTLRTSGSNPYNDYDKRRYRERAEKMVADGDAAAHLLNEGERDDLLAQHRDTPKPKVQQVAYTLPSLQQLAGVVSDLLQETVVSATIQALKGDPDLAGWTRKGLGLHKDRNSKKCLFCEQPLPAGRLDALEAHFSAEYEQFLGKLDEQIRQLQAASDQAAGVELPDSARLYADLVTEYDEAKSAVRKALERVHEFLEVLIRALNDKKAKPFDRVTLDAAVPPLDADVVDRLNVVIRKHNQACEGFQARIATARERLALDMIAVELDEFVQLGDDVRQADADVKTAKQEVQRLTTEIERLEREIVEHRQPAEELNRDLYKYLGHGELQLAIKDTGYSIMRNGQPAKMLSEGEMTAI